MIRAKKSWRLSYVRWGFLAFCDGREEEFFSLDIYERKAIGELLWTEYVAATVQAFVSTGAVEVRTPAGEMLRVQEQGLQAVLAEAQQQLHIACRERQQMKKNHS